MNIEIREATAADARDVRSLVEVVLPAAYDFLDPAYAKRELAQWELDALPARLEDEVFVVAEVNGRIIAMASAMVDDRGRFVMSTLHVHPDHQGSQLGSRLLTEVVSLVDAPLWTRYPDGDENAAAFCARHRFVVAEKVDDPPYGVAIWVRRDPE